MSDEHDLHINKVKGILIILVIIGHVLQLGEDRFSTTVINWIYTFHMPLFIMVSGYLTNTISPRYKKGTLKLLETYFVFQILRSIIEGNFDLHSFMIPRMALWYLLSLVYWRILMYFLINIMKISGALLLFISLIISIVSVFFPYTTQLSFQRTFAFFPFLVCGYLCRNIDYKKVLRKFSTSFAITFLVLTLLCYYIKNKSFLLELSGTQTIQISGGGY